MKKTPKLSQSIAWAMLSRSPAHAWWEHRDLGGKERKPTDAMKEGTLRHELLLGGNKVVVADFDSFKSNAAKEVRDAALAQGLVPIVRKKAEEAEKPVAKLRSAIADRGFDLGDFQRETRLFWTDREGVECAGTPDAFRVDGASAAILEVKIVGQSAHPDDLARKVDEGWALQRAAYISALQALHPEVRGRVEWLWVAQEKDPPWEVSIVPAGGSMDDLGFRQWHRALSQWRELLTLDPTKPWPGYTNQPLEAPAWALAKEEYHDETE